MSPCAGGKLGVVQQHRAGRPDWGVGGREISVGEPREILGLVASSLRRVAGLGVLELWGLGRHLRLVEAPLL